jgi:C-terminal processing protease CtpA/Prc
MTAVLLLWLIAIPASAQLTRDQKVHDFENIASLYAKRYAPYEWKKRLFGFDALKIGPWLERVRTSKDDLEFFEVVLEYVASLDDTHSSYSMPSNFVADLGLTVDIYDGKVLIESINRTRLPLATYPFAIGDELVSVDGESSQALIEYFSRFFKRANPVATRRSVADFITRRPQAKVPRVIDLPDEAVVVIARQSGGEETYVLPWTKTGTPLRWIGAVPSPRRYLPDLPPDIPTGTPSYFEAWLELTNFRLPSTDHLLAGETVNESGARVPRRYVLGLGSRTPVFIAGLPATFVQRLGRNASEFHFSGVYEADGLRIGFLRFPNFAPPAAALQELRNEVAYLQENTDGLVVDVMRNPGGGCYMFEAASYLIPHPFFFFGEEVRVTYARIAQVQLQLEAAQRANVPALVAIYTEWLRELEDAYRKNRGMTAPLPACSTQMHDNAPAQDEDGNVIAYSKPIIVLVDEFSLSAGDIFPAMLQDNRRGPLVGTRTNGAGGSVSAFPVGIYSESVAGNTNTLVTRIAPVKVPGYPKSAYIENIGAHADVRLDYMTRENLLGRGQAFVAAFTQIMTAHIRGELQLPATKADDEADTEDSAAAQEDETGGTATPSASDQAAPPPDEVLASAADAPEAAAAPSSATVPVGATRRNAGSRPTSRTAIARPAP